MITKIKGTKYWQVKVNGMSALAHSEDEAKQVERDMQLGNLDLSEPNDMKSLIRSVRDAGPLD